MRPFVNSEIVSGPAERASNWREGIGVPYAPGAEAYGWERGIADDNRWLSVARRPFYRPDEEGNVTKPVEGERNNKFKIGDRPYSKCSVPRESRIDGSTVRIDGSNGQTTYYPDRSWAT